MPWGDKIVKHYHHESENDCPFLSISTDHDSVDGDDVLLMVTVYGGISVAILFILSTVIIVLLILILRARRQHGKSKEIGI